MTDPSAVRTTISKYRTYTLASKCSLSLQRARPPGQRCASIHIWTTASHQREIARIHRHTPSEADVLPGRRLGWPYTRTEGARLIRNSPQGDLPRPCVALGSASSPRLLEEADRGEILAARNEWNAPKEETVTDGIRRRTNGQAGVHVRASTRASRRARPPLSQQTQREQLTIIVFFFKHKTKSGKV